MSIDDSMEDINEPERVEMFTSNSGPVCARLGLRVLPTLLQVTINKCRADTYKT